MDKILTDKHTHTLSFCDSDGTLRLEHLRINFNFGVTGGSFETCFEECEHFKHLPGFCGLLFLGCRCCFWEQYEGGAQQTNVFSSRERDMAD